MPAEAQLAALPMLLEHGVWAHSVVLRARARVCEPEMVRGRRILQIRGVRRAAVGLTCGP